MRADATRGGPDDWPELDPEYEKALARRAGLYFWTVGSDEFHTYFWSAGSDRFHWIRDCPVLNCEVARGAQLVTSAEPPSPRTAPTCTYCFGCLPDPREGPLCAEPCRTCGCPRAAHGESRCSAYWYDQEFSLFTGQYGNTEDFCPCDGYREAGS